MLFMLTVQSSLVIRLGYCILPATMVIFNGLLFFIQRPFQKDFGPFFFVNSSFFSQKRILCSRVTLNYNMGNSYHS